MGQHNMSMMKAYKEGLGVDFALVCQGVTKHVHSQVIMARSPYLEAKVNRWCKEKRELVIEDCDLVTFDIIVDFMYGGPIPESAVTEENSVLAEIDLQDTEALLQYSNGKLGRLAQLLHMSDKLLMVDLKGGGGGGHDQESS